MIRPVLCLLALPLSIPAAARASTDGPSPAESQRFAWRSIGPAVFGGRIVDIAVDPSDTSFVLVASASGGLFRSVNRGTTWDCIFQDEGTTSIGAIALDPTDRNVIWVGTGEANNQRSSYWGDGVYKTTDGGKSWTNLGLADSHHIGRIAIDPSDPQRVFVAALGHLYTPNEERGLYRTTDGGASWERVAYVDADVGFVDVVIDPSDPSRVYAASYERRRRAWNFDGAGPGSGIWRSLDGGDHFTRLEGGLPTGEIGRIGLALFPGDGQLLYACVSNQNQVPLESKPKPSLRTRFRDGRLEVLSLRKDGGAAALGLARGDILLRLGDVDLTSSFAAVKAIAKYQSRPEDEEVELLFEREGERRTLKLHVADLLETPPEKPRTRSVGGEVYRSTDGGDTWVKVNEKPVGGSPAYYYGQIRVDPQNADVVYLLGVPVVRSTDGGHTWSGNLAGGVHVDHHALWIDPANSNSLILGNDGGLHFSYDRGETWRQVNNLPIAQFYAVGVDREVPYRVYGGTQDNGTWGGPSRSRSSRGIGNGEWYSIGGGDGFYAVPDPSDATTVYGESQFGFLYRRDLEGWDTRSIRPAEREGDEPYRFNWNSPILISHHNPGILYFGGNRLFKSFDRGDTWPIVSEDLTTADPEKLEGNVPHCTLTTLAESPFDPNLVLVGSDDGLVHVSRDGCLTFENLSGRFPGVPQGWWVNRVEFSPHDRDTAYVAFTGYREDDFRAFLFRTTDGCRTWSSIAEGLPAEGVNVVREDPSVPGVLYVGTELGAYVSLDAGESWAPLGKGLPRVAVYDLVVHPRDGELVAGTHGRGIWILDVRILRQLAESHGEGACLLAVGDVQRLQRRDHFGWDDQGNYYGTNPEEEARIGYLLPEGLAKGDVELWIEDVTGERIAELGVEFGPGLHLAAWNLRGKVQVRGEVGAPRKRGRAPAGIYAAVLKVKGELQRQGFQLRDDPLLADR